MKKLYKVWCAECNHLFNVTPNQVVQAKVESTFNVTDDDETYNIYFFRAFCTRCATSARVYAYEDDSLFNAVNDQKKKPIQYEIKA